MGNSKVMKCSRSVNAGRMDVRLNDKQPKEEDCYKYLWSQVAANVDVVRIKNERYKARGVLKCLLRNTGLARNAKRCLYEGIIVPTAS